MTVENSSGCSTLELFEGFLDISGPHWNKLQDDTVNDLREDFEQQF